MHQPNPMTDLWTAQARAMGALTEAAVTVMTAWMRAPLFTARDVTVYFPFGQGYSQNIDPSTNWGWITAQATDQPEVEREIVRREASYGTQIGILLDLVLDLAQESERGGPGRVDKAKLDEAERLKSRITEIKRKYNKA